MATLGDIEEKWRDRTVRLKTENEGLVGLAALAAIIGIEDENFVKVVTEIVNNAIWMLEICISEQARGRVIVSLPATSFRESSLSNDPEITRLDNINAVRIRDLELAKEYLLKVSAREAKKDDRADQSIPEFPEPPPEDGLQ